MQPPIPDYLADILDHVRDDDGGQSADYIPELRDADPDRLALALCTTSGHVYSAGDGDVEFTIQSISKPFIYALALQELGADAVDEVVGLVVDKRMPAADLVRLKSELVAAGRSVLVAQRTKNVQSVLAQLAKLGATHFAFVREGTAAGDLEVKPLD